MYLFLLLGLLAPPTPVLQIVAPTLPVSPGKNIRISVIPPTPTSTLVSTSYIWIVQPPVDDLDEWPDHTKITFGSGIVSTSYTITVIGSFVYQTTDKTISQSLLTARTTIQVMPPPPPPPPPPGPSLPDGKYKLSSYIYNISKNMPVQEAHILANSLSSIAKKGREGAYANKAAMINATKISNNAALGSNIEAWKPILDSLANAMNLLKASLPLPSDISGAYDEISTGLLAVGP